MNQIEIYKIKENNLFLKMVALKNEIGIFQYSHAGRKATVDFNKGSNNSPKQLRWRFFNKNRNDNAIKITAPFYLIINKENRINQNAIDEILALKKSVYWDKVNEFEKQRTYMNLAMRASFKILETLEMLKKVQY